MLIDEYIDLIKSEFNAIKLKYEVVTNDNSKVVYSEIGNFVFQCDYIMRFIATYPVNKKISYKKLSEAVNNFNTWAVYTKAIWKETNEEDKEVLILGILTGVCKENFADMFSAFMAEISNEKSFKLLEEIG